MVGGTKHLGNTVTQTKVRPVTCHFAPISRSLHRENNEDNSDKHTDITVFPILDGSEIKYPPNFDPRHRKWNWSTNPGSINPGLPIEALRRSFTTQRKPSLFFFTPSPFHHTIFTKDVRSYHHEFAQRSVKDTKTQLPR